VFSAFDLVLIKNSSAQRACGAYLLSRRFARAMQLPIFGSLAVGFFACGPLAGNTQVYNLRHRVTRGCDFCLSPSGPNIT